MTLSPNGMATNTAKAGTIDMSGARLNSSLSALYGTISSLNRSFIMSANGCNTPCGPTLQGPSLTCMWPATFLSIHVSGRGSAKTIMVTTTTLNIIIAASIRIVMSGIRSRVKEGGYSAGSFPAMNSWQDAFFHNLLCEPLPAPHVVDHLYVAGVHPLHDRVDGEDDVPEELIYD